MATLIKVRASNPGYAGRWRAGSRHFANGTEYALEVVDDPPGRKLGEHEPETEPGVSSMTHISKAGLAALEGDEHISVLKGDDAKVKELANKAGDLEAENAQLRKELERTNESAGVYIDKLRERVTELEDGNTSLKDRCVELEKQLADATKAKTPNEGETDGTKVPEVKPEADGKAKAKSGKAGDK